MKLVSPMTSAPLVVSTTTKLSDEIERRLTASAGYDSLVHCQTPSPSARLRASGAMHEAAFLEHTEHFLKIQPSVFLRSS